MPDLPPRVKKIICLGYAVWLFFILSNCRSSYKSAPPVEKVEPASVRPLPTATVTNKIVLNVPKFARQSSEELEKILGNPAEVKTVADKKGQNRSEYRLYRLPDHPQGLTIHFYDGRAMIFNLVLGKSLKSPREALLNYFGIDLDGAQSIEKTQFLEKWQGKFNGVNFASVYAMKERVEREDYKLLHAEVVR